MDNETDAAGKAFWKSKTIWVMAASMLSMMVPQVKEWLDTNPVSYPIALASAAILLRFVTHGKISLGWEKDGGGHVPLLLLGCTLAGVLGFSSVSCSPTAFEGVTGSVYYIDSNSGAKGGLDFSDGRGRARVTVPILDTEGREVGRASLAKVITVESAK